MLGTVVNALAIVAGSLVGLLLKGGVPRQYNVTIMQAISLAVILIGLKMALRSDAVLLVIFSLAAGSVVGQWLRIEGRLEGLGQRLEARFSKNGQGLSKGFVVATLVFCVGSMAIVGALESGLSGNHQTLFAKSALDGVASIVFASTLGLGVLFASLSVLVYQGLITIGASLIKGVLAPAVIDQMSSVGGLLIMAIGINLLEIKKIYVGNMLPAIFVPPLYLGAKQLVAFLF